MAVTFARPMHPGEFLPKEYLVPLNMTAGQLARALGLPRTRIKRIVREEIGVSTDPALRLARFFRTSPGFWLNLQQSYEIETRPPRIADELARITPLPAAPHSDAA